jgi:membrane fusion protein, multidrug efflux system
MQPIAVLFTLAEDDLSPLRSAVKKGVSLPVTAWNRDQKVKFATGFLTAVDNQIDQQTGTAKLKAEFDNKDQALFPGQFVIARVLLNPQ